MTRVRISRRVISHLEGGDAWQRGQGAVDNGAERQSTVDMTEAIKNAPVRSDGSVTVELSAEQRETLYSYAEVMAIGAKDNIEPPPWGDPDYLHDYNAARALLRQLDRLAS